MLKRLGQKLSRTRFAAWLLARLIRVWCSTLRWELVRGPEFVYRPLAEREAFVVGFWHNRLFVSTEFYRHFFPQGNGVALISRSRDGNLFSRIIEELGFGTARGSSSKGGGFALLGLLRRMKEEKADIGITPDGPRGPRYRVQPGIIQLAQSSGAKILLWKVEFDRKWELKSWDRFQIPKPFTRARVRIEEPLTVPADLSETEFEALRVKVEQLLGEG